jgi:hypothetical protein
MTSIRKGILYIFLFFGLLGISQFTWAQSTNQKIGSKTTFQVSLVPGLSTSDSYSTSQVSLNIIGGYNGSFHGFELGAAFNANRYNISGLQLGGVVNANQQEAHGLLLAGGLNISQTFSGVSFAGAVNITKNHTDGLMAAGGINIVRETRGLNIASFNVAKNQMGTQIGVFNIGRRLEGTQIGIINIVSENNGGTPIGLLSFVKNGRYNVDLWGSETGFINGGIRFGTETIYNILSIGYNPFYGDNLWQVGLGIGYHYELNENGDGLETDLAIYNVNYGGKWTTKTSNHIQWRLHYTHSFTESIGIFVGPSLNLMITDKKLSVPQVPYTIYDHSSSSDQMRGWIGGTLGIELF